MIDPDTTDSVQADAPSGQDPATTAPASPTAGTGDAGDVIGRGSAGDAAPDPQAVKTAGDDSSAAKDPEAWVTGDEPMTGPQASYLATLAQQAGVAPPEGLTKAEASEAIDELRQRAGR